MASPAQLKNFFARTGDNVAGAGRPIKELPKAQELLASLAKSPAQKAALVVFDTHLKEWVVTLNNTVKT